MTIVLNSDMGSQILDKLSSLVDVDAVCRVGGVVAGQSVASAVSELFGDGRAVVYNDVDLFRSVKDSERKGKKGRVLEMDAKFMTETAVDYSQLCLKTCFHYRVARTRRDGMLNEVMCYGGIRDFLVGQSNIKRFLNTFDLNCVQVAVDTVSKQLIWTQEFERFHKTRQLMVSNVKTPVHTAIRWFRKKLELQGIFGNDQFNLELLSAVIERINPESPDDNNEENAGFDRKKEILSGRINFSTHYLEKLAPVKEDVAKWFNHSG